jgi:hypothetical protein
MLTDEQISELRSRFPILREKTYLYKLTYAQRLNRIAPPD